MVYVIILLYFIQLIGIIKMTEQNTIKIITDNYSKEMNYRMMRPLSERFKPDTVYTFPTVDGVVLLKSDNPMAVPELKFSDIAIQFEYAAITPSLKFLAENRNVYSVSIPTQMRFNLLNLEIVPNQQIEVLNGTLDMSVAEIIYNAPETQKEVKQDFNVNFIFSFTTLHDNVTYTAIIDSSDLLEQMMKANASKEFQG